MADDLDSSPNGHEGLILEHSPKAREPQSGILAQAPNALTVSRFALAAAWIALASATPDAYEAFAAIAITAAATDFIDGRIARRLGVAHESGGWLDSVADVTFVLAALGCYASARELPWLIPILIAASFTQYTIDSLWLHRAAAPVRSRLGHWGGIINYALVLAMALSRPNSIVREQVTGFVPVIALFYMAAIIERALAYRRARPT